MDHLDLLYRSYKEYRKNTAQNSESISFREASKKSNPGGDSVVVKTQTVEIEEDWVKAIEEGLVYLEKAVQEDRQFIRNNGEVVPIEKARRVSKTSVEHLARHADYITRKPADASDDIVPDKILMVEKLSDYAVYENRFLYLCLMYLNDFISARYDKIQDITNKYQGSLSLNKSITLGKRHLVYVVRLNEENHNDPYIMAHNKSMPMIERIYACLHGVLQLLKTPLMVEVAKAPMIKPPVVKTNVLKMNLNFKNSLALYDYVTSYKGDGYKIIEKNQVLSPLKDEEGDEMGDLIALSSFLTYQDGNGLRNELEKNYQLEEMRRKEEEEKRLAEQVRSLKKRLEEGGSSFEEYALLLEKENKALERKVLAKEEAMERLKVEQAKEIAALKKQQEDEIAALLKKQEEELAKQQAAFSRKLMEEQQKYEKSLQEIRTSYEEKVAFLQKNIRDLHEKMDSTVQAYEEQIKQLTATYEEKIKQEKEAHDKAFEELRSQDATLLEKEEKERDRKIAELDSQLQSAQNGKTMALAELHALREKEGKIGNEEDFTSPERFAELEKEKEAFDALFDREWKATKKAIWRRLFSEKPGKKEKK
jgi:hypothetical protein